MVAKSSSKQPAKRGQTPASVKPARAKKPTAQKPAIQKTIGRQVTKCIWCSAILVGIASIVFGFIALLWPGLTLSILFTMFGIFVIAIGAVWFFEAFMHVGKDRLWWLGVFFGLLAVAGGIWLLSNPSIALGIFAILIALFVFAQALFNFIVASYSKKGNRWSWVLLGVLGIIFGFVILGFNPSWVSTVFVWVIGLYALIHGIMVLASACAMKKHLNVKTKKK